MTSRGNAEPGGVAATLHDLETPALVLDRTRLAANIARLRAHLAELGVPLRPHLKTAKSVEVARLATEGQPGGIAVSTLKEAEAFFEQGFEDVLYAVGIAPNKLAHATSLVERGCRLTLITDNVAAAEACSTAAAARGVKLPVLVELDVDGHRSGVDPDSGELLEIARVLNAGRGTELRGVLTHAGESYNCRSTAALVGMAEQERAGAVRAAERLRRAGLECRVVSVGSTPTATFARDLRGVTEVRAGVYMFGDLVMAGLGVLEPAQIAVSVLVSVIGHQPAKGWIITDGGWMALSRDRGTADQPVDQGYGTVLGVDGEPLPDDLVVVSANQEHGVVARRDGKRYDLSRYPVGCLLRVLPNHACATSAQHAAYQVVTGRNAEVLARWPRFGGW